jgi:hypothetical protein
MPLSSQPRFLFSSTLLLSFPIPFLFPHLCLVTVDLLDNRGSFTVISHEV